MLVSRSHVLRAVLVICVLVTLATFAHAAERLEIKVRSSLDKTDQPAGLVLPRGFTERQAPAPLLVWLHSWSADYRQRNAELERLAAAEGWVYLMPNFRGPNNRPEACGSLVAQQDILDAVDWVVERYEIDQRRIYLAGASGGGHMTMLMVGRHPQRWAAASAWVGISDLAAWHARHASSRYGEMLRNSCGGAPGSSPETDEQYRQRSPLTYLQQAVEVPLDLAAGIHDGHQGSVPIRHTLNAFNVLARAAGHLPISDDEIAQLSRPGGRLLQPTAGDQVEDASFGRAIYLRRTAGNTRVTIFEGGHEDLPTATIAWLKQHRQSQ